MINSGWGFCTQECFPNHKEPYFGKARESLIDVLDAEHCEKDLTENGSKDFVMKPEVLCVGYNQSYNIRVYLKDANGNYHHVESSNPHYKNLLSKEKSWYIVGKLLYLFLRNLENLVIVFQLLVHVTEIREALYSNRLVYTNPMFT